MTLSAQELTKFNYVLPELQLTVGLIFFLTNTFSVKKRLSGGNENVSAGKSLGRSAGSMDTGHDLHIESSFAFIL